MSAAQTSIVIEDSKEIVFGSGVCLYWKNRISGDHQDGEEI